MVKRSALKPRSLSPIGPEPTRDPRIAEPPVVLMRLDQVEALEQTEGDNDCHPHDAENDGDSVEVSLSHT